MKHIVDSSQVTHLWAHQLQDNARNAQGNIYFQGTCIYSYGSHFCMGRIITTGESVVLTNRGYSNTTAKHLYETRYAVNHYAKRVYVALPDARVFTNLPDFIHQIKSNLETIGNTRKRQATRDQAQVDLLSIAENIDLYFEVMGTTFAKVQRDCRKSIDKAIQNFPLYYKACKSEAGSKELVAKLADIRAKVSKKEIKEALKREAEAKEAIDKWKRGSSYYPFGYYPWSSVYLRISENGQDIETSKGASVSINEARALYTLIKRGDNVLGHEIGGYAVLGNNGHLKIGCHEIERTEIERFAIDQNW